MITYYTQGKVLGVKVTRGIGHGWPDGHCCIINPTVTLVQDSVFRQGWVSVSSVAHAPELIDLAFLLGLIQQKVDVSCQQPGQVIPHREATF